MSVIIALVAIVGVPLFVTAMVNRHKRSVARASKALDEVLFEREERT